MIHESPVSASIMYAKHCICFWFHVSTDVRAYVSTDVMEPGTLDEMSHALREHVCV